MVQMSKKIVEYKGLQSKNVVMANVITRSSQRLNLVEKRILFSAIAKLGGVFGVVKFSAKDYAETFEIKNIDTAYQELKAASKTFLQRHFSVKYLGDNNKPETAIYNWLSHVVYRDAVIEIHLNPNIHQFLFELEHEFTKYQLKQASALRSTYSWRLLELFEQMRNSSPTKKDNEGKTLTTKKNDNGWLLISLDDFNHAMDTPKSYKNNFGIIRQKIIEPSIKELTEKDGWTIELEIVKKGRKVTHLNFLFEKDKQGRFNL